MAVNPLTDIQLRFSNVKLNLADSSTNQGNADNSDPTTAANAATYCLGRYLSTAGPATGTRHNLLDIIGSSETAAGETEYRCIFLANINPNDAWTNVTVWISGQTAGGSSVQIALDPKGVVALNTGSGIPQAGWSANENTAPTVDGTNPLSLTWSSAPDEASALALGTLFGGECRAIWIKRTVVTTAAAQTDAGCSLSFRGTAS